MLTVLPPGAEDLALRTLSCLLHPSLLRSVRSAAEEALRRFHASGSTLCEAALRRGAWQQKVLLLDSHASIGLLQPVIGTGFWLCLTLCYVHFQLCKARCGCLPSQRGRCPMVLGLAGCLREQRLHALCQNLLRMCTPYTTRSDHIW